MSLKFFSEKRRLCGFSAGLSCIMLIIVMLSLSVNVSAQTVTYDGIPYKNYTYWTAGSGKRAVETKAVYESLRAIGLSEFGNSEKMKIEYVCHDSRGNINILDSGNGVIYIFDSNYNYVRTVNSVNINGENASFAGARGIYYDADDTLYISDTQNKRVICRYADNSVKIITKPESDIIPNDFSFAPLRAARDNNGFLYILCEGSYYGLVVLSPDDEFIGFFGATEVQGSVLGAITGFITSMFETKEKHEASVKELPYQIEDIAVSSGGFITAVTSESKGQIRMFSPNGSNILRAKNQFSYTAGDSYNFADSPNAFVLSTAKYGLLTYEKFAGVTTDKDGYIYALDATVGRIFMYDDYCNLISVFGGGISQGSQLGTFYTPVSIESNGDDLAVVDFMNKNLTVFRLTDFGKKLKTAQQLTNAGKYSEAEPLWKEISAKDKNCQLAYIGLAKAELENGNYAAAMKYSKSGLDQKTYSQAYKFVRNEFIAANFKWFALTAALFIALLFVVKHMLRKKGVTFKVNDKIKVCFATIYKPIDTFNQQICVKNNGSVILAVLLLVMFYVSSVCTKLLGGFSFNLINLTDFNALYTLLGTVGTVLLYTVVNWAVCTLFEGKGGIKNIFITSCYSLWPLIINYVLFIVLSQVLIPTNNSSLSILETVFGVMFVVWLLLSITTVHDFSFFKAVGMAVLILLGMAISIFVIFVMLTLGQNLIAFLLSVVQEIRMR